MQYLPPDDSKRLTILGKTGSGKTQAAVWHLANRSWKEKPWIVFDFKRDELIDQIGAKEVNITRPPPRTRGLYVVRPNLDQDEFVDAYLWQIWENEHTGVFIDEGYMIGNRSKPLRAILTQGRSKRVPLILLSQRPVWLDRFALSEADYFQVFAMTDARDRAIVNSFVPFDVSDRLPDYNSYWYDVPRDFKARMAPVPSADEIIDIFEYRRGDARKVVNI